MKKFALIVPAYNEAKNLPTLLERTTAAAREAGFESNNFSFVVVDNGSHDNSFEVAKNWIETNNCQDMIRVVRVDQNQGYGFGILSGLKAADSEVVGWTHADLQCDPKNAFKAYHLLQEKGVHKTLIKGHRLGRARQERLVSRVFELLAKCLLGLRDGEINAQPKVFHRELLSSLSNPPHGFELDIYLLYKAQKNSYQTHTIDVFFPPRIHGVSHWAANFAGRYKTIWGMIRYMWKLARTEGRA